jgi:hypothetical protein
VSPSNVRAKREVSPGIPGLGKKPPIWRIDLHDNTTSLELKFGTIPGEVEAVRVMK